jgi:hypothetical protein
VAAYPEFLYACVRCVLLLLCLPQQCGLHRVTQIFLKYHIFANCICLACIVILCVFVMPYVYLLHLMCICCILCVFVVPFVYLLYLMYICLSYVYLLYLMCICCTMCVLLLLLYTPDCWLEVSTRKVLRPATSTQVFLGFPVSPSEC